MKPLWNALIARLVHMLTPNPPKLPLKPGICECEHGRCMHVSGKGRCTVQYPANVERPYVATCACEIFILDEDNDDDDEPETPTPSELEKLYQR